MGVANDRSIAWTAAEAASRAGARLAFTYQNHAMERRVVPLAESVGAEITVPCDVAEDAEIDYAFDVIAKHWESISKAYLKHRYSIRKACVKHLKAFVKHF